jgi:hypothetical protein
MRPKTKTADIPSSHDVGVYVHNECVRWLKQLREEIKVSMGAGMIAENYRSHQVSGHPGYSLDDFGWLVGRQHEGGVLGSDSALDRCERKKVEFAV